MSDQLPIVLHSSQVLSLQKLLDRVICRDAEAIEIRQSRGPVALNAVFVDVMNTNENDIQYKRTFVIDPSGGTSEWLV